MRDKTKTATGEVAAQGDGDEVVVPASYRSHSTTSAAARTPTSPAATRRQPWRYRRCPSCQRVYPAGSIKPMVFGSHWEQRGYSKRQCPGCGRTAPTYAFEVVRERRASGGAP